MTVFVLMKVFDLIFRFQQAVLCNAVYILEEGPDNTKLEAEFALPYCKDQVYTDHLRISAKNTIKLVVDPFNTKPGRNIFLSLVSKAIYIHTCTNHVIQKEYRRNSFLPGALKNKKFIFVLY